jgi:hypothetical protein
MKVVLIGIMLILYRNGSAWNEVRMPIPQRYESHHHHPKGVDRKQIELIDRVNEESRVWGR